VNAFVKLPGGASAVYNAGGLSFYRHADHLGSSRLATTTTRTKYYDVAYAPYGEDYDGSGTQDLAFTDQNQDTMKNGWSTNLYDFIFREYRTAHGRWSSPDPAGMGAVEPANPQSWNRYAYVLNNPTGLVDPLGLKWVCHQVWGSGAWIDTGSGTPVYTGSQALQICYYVPDVPDSVIVNGSNGGGNGQTTNGGGSGGGGAADMATISAGTLDQLNDYCSARGRAKFVADWLPGGSTIAKTLWGSHNGEQLGFYQLSTADLNNITGENSGGQTVAVHAASEGVKAAAGSTAFLSWLRGATGVPKTLAGKWLGRLSIALIVADASSGFYKEGKEIINCEAGN